MLGVISGRLNISYSADNFVFDELKPLQTNSNAIIKLYVIKMTPRKKS